MLSKTYEEDYLYYVQRIKETLVKKINEVGY